MYLQPVHKNDSTSRDLLQNRLREKASGRPALMAMIHVHALPGTPRSSASVRDLVRQVETEAGLLLAAGVDGIVLENMHDRPYLKRNVGPEITAGMTAAALALRAKAPDLLLGVQVLAGANRSALAVALAADLDFIRAESFVFGHLADEGWMDADAGSLLRYRAAIGAEHIAVVADIKKKHSAHAASADVSLVETAQAADFFLADGIVVTGQQTGEAADREALQAVRRAVDMPLFVGSGITPENAVQYVDADAWIVGSSLKADGHWWANPDPARVAKMVAAVQDVVRS